MDKCLRNNEHWATTQPRRMGSHFLEYTTKCHGFAHRLFLCAFVEIQLRVHLHSVNRSLKSSSSVRQWQKMKMCKNYLKKENIYKHWSVAWGDETPMPEKGKDQMRFKSILLCLALLGSCKHSRYLQAPCVLLGSGRKTDGSRKSGRSDVKLMSQMVFSKFHLSRTHTWKPTT